MIISKRIHWTPLILIFFFTYEPNAQNFDIQLCPLEHIALTKSLICLSDADGQPVFEHILSNDEIIDGSFYSIPVSAEKNYSLTILNEYRIDSINDGKPFIKAMSFYEAGRDVKILRFDHPVIRPFLHSRPVLLSIINCPLIEEFVTYSKTRLPSFWKLNKNEIWSQVNFQPGEDVYIVIKARNDDRRRYIYLEEDKIPVLNQTRPSKDDAIKLDWRFLPTNLVEYNIPLPLEGLKDGYISAVNNNTNNKCYFFYLSRIHNNNPSTISHGTMSTKRTDFTGMNLQFFIPSNIGFNNMNSEFSFYIKDLEKWVIYRYRHTHGDNTQLPAFSLNHFQLKGLSHDSLSFYTDLGNFPEYFKIVYYKSTGAEFGIGKPLYHFRDSQWHVVGENKGSIDFVIPKFSEQALEEFPAMDRELGRWHVRDFEMIKVLEPNHSIDWINFLDDYNLLYVTPGIK